MMRRGGHCGNLFQNEEFTDAKMIPVFTKNYKKDNAIPTFTDYMVV